MTPNRVAIIDSGLSNVDSVRRAVEECGGTAMVATAPGTLREADRIILPGVGAFGHAMERLRASGLMEELQEAVIGEGAPFLGICLGMHLTAQLGTEGGDSPGLGWVAAKVERLVPTGPDRRVPHVGWNEVHPEPGALLFQGIAPGTDFYFVHSYHVACQEEGDVAAVTPYCGGFTSAIAREHIFGVQFHPEKSQKAGFKVLTNFLAC